MLKEYVKLGYISWQFLPTGGSMGCGHVLQLLNHKIIATGACEKVITDFGGLEQLILCVYLNKFKGNQI